SELVTPMNFSDGCVFETTRRFQDASAAFINPARRPTRGSGLGGVVDMLPAPADGVAMLLLPADEDDEAHPAIDNAPRASVRLRNVAAVDRTPERRA
ncbi:MAG: hypothetical protein ABI679_04670, partial [Gemmatimonadota bacterium]